MVLFYEKQGEEWPHAFFRFSALRSCRNSQKPRGALCMVRSLCATSPLPMNLCKDCTPSILHYAQPTTPHTKPFPSHPSFHCSSTMLPRH